MKAFDETERQRFVDWTFDKELAQIEDWVAEFDRDAPGANLFLARFQAELHGSNEDGKDEDADRMPLKRDNLFPHFLGHDMSWWSNMCRKMLNSANSDPCLLDHLGIREAVEAWIADENAWEKRRAVARRNARRQGRNWIAESIPAVR